MRRPDPAGARRGSGERGSSLMLFPAAVLVLIVLGALAVDTSIAFLGERELANITAAAANDIASVAVAEEAYYREGRYELDVDRVLGLARAANDDAPAYLRITCTEVEVDGTRVRVLMQATADLVFAKGLPGAPRDVDLESESSAQARIVGAGVDVGDARYASAPCPTR